mgnify:FL=1
MKISINRSHVNKMPQDAGPEWWRAYNGAFENEEIDAADVLMFACLGWAYCAQVDGYRKVANFTAAQHLDLDFDDGSRNIYQLAGDPFIARYASFLYETASSTADHPKVRVFFELDQPITDAAKYKLLRDSLLARFPTADRAHRDVCRLAFGSKNCLYGWLGNVLTLETAVNELVKPYQAAQQQTAVQQQKTAVSGAISQPSDNLLGAFLRGKLDYLLDQVRAAPDGQKYYTLQRVAFTLGGYVATGYYSGPDIANHLYNAIRANPNNVKSLAAAETCINAALTAGQGRPLYVDLSGIETSQTAVSAAQVDDTWQTAVSGGAYSNWVTSKRAAVWAGVE